MSAQQIDAGMRAGGEIPGMPGHYRPDFDMVFGGIQNFLNAAGNISKACWGNYSDEAIADRAELRESLGLTDDHVLGQPRTVRNHLEHFDERLDRWWRESEHHTFVDTNIGPEGAVVTARPTYQFRNFDPVSGIFKFWDDRIDLAAVARAIEELLRRALVEAEKPHWEAPSI